MSDTANKKNIFVEIFSMFFGVFKFAFIGIKACTYDLFLFLYNSISWKLDKAYKRTKNAIGSNDSDDTDGYSKKKKAKKYKYSEKTMAKLEAEYKVLVNELQTSGATRTKEPDIYRYTVQDENGKIIKGTMSGLSKLDINSFLVNEGYKVYSIETSKMINFLYKDTLSFGGRKLSTKELNFFLTQLATYIKAGITLSDAIKILSRQMEKQKSKASAFQAISYELLLGSSFSNALEKQGDMFPALLINMVKAAEASGTLTETLEDMATYYSEMDETKKQMKSAMTYPIIISVFSIAVITFILVYIIPKFVTIYETNHIEIAGLTKVIINLGNFLANNIFLILLIVGIVIAVFILTYKKLKAFRRAIQKLLMKTPVVKDVIIYNELTIFTKTFASLLRNNVFITESIDILSKITNNEIYKGILYRTINNIVKGEKISEAFKDHWAVPEVAYFMIVTGESTGQLPEMMQKVSDYYQGLHKNTINSLKAFIEPVLISVLALVVGTIIIAVVIPMFNMYKSLI